MGKGQGTREWGARELGSWHRRGPSSHASRLQHSDLCGLRVSRNLLSTQIVTKTTRYSCITHAIDSNTRNRGVTLTVYAVHAGDPPP